VPVSSDPDTATEVAAFRESLANHLRCLRVAHETPHTSVASAIGVVIAEFRLYETGERVPSLPRLRRLANVYGMSLVELLEQVGASVAAKLGQEAPDLAATLLLYGGVTPSQAHRRRADPAPRVVSAGDRVEPASAVVGTRSTDPERMRTAQDLRLKYEAGMSIRDLAVASGVAWGTARTLLIEAGTTLRPRGGDNRLVRPTSVR
jgi:transcriptional regulator with XRE-family HTH domain